MGWSIHKHLLLDFNMNIWVLQHSPFVFGDARGNKLVFPLHRSCSFIVLIPPHPSLISKLWLICTVMRWKNEMFNYDRLHHRKTNQTWSGGWKLKFWYYSMSRKLVRGTSKIDATQWSIKEVWAFGAGAMWGKRESVLT